jgi:hypothetical protein
MSEWKGIECFDNTELDAFRRCQKYYNFFINKKKQRANDKKTAAEFGIAIHGILEDVYKGMDLLTSLEKWIPYFAPFESDLDAKRTCGKLRELMMEYFIYYENDTFVPIPQYIEVGFAVELMPNVLYTGRLDAPGYYKNRPNEMYVMDHKTTWKILGYLVKPHNQFTGYIFGARQYMEGVVGVVANLIGVYKDKPMRLKNSDGWRKGAAPEDVFFRSVTTRSDEEIEQWRIEACALVDDIRRANDRGIYHGNSMNCKMFNRDCPYMDVCNVAPAMQDEFLECDMYVTKEWKPYKNLEEEETEDANNHEGTIRNPSPQDG